MTFLLPVGRYVWHPSVPVRYAVCSVSFKVFPNLTKHWGKGPRGRLVRVRRSRHCRLA